jgi:hypothetical protein
MLPLLLLLVLTSFQAISAFAFVSLPLASQSATMSASASASADVRDVEDVTPSDTPLLALPSAPSNPSQEIRSMSVNGPGISFSELGPIIINSDGTTRAISNWDKMSKPEQDKTWERIARRNKERIEILKAEGKGVVGMNMNMKMDTDTDTDTNTDTKSGGHEE